MTTIIDRYANAVPVWLVDANGNAVGTAQAAPVSDMDTDGNPVPTYKPQTFTYDDSGNLITATVRDGSSSWVRTLTWTGGAQSADSGWVKQ